ncbi:MAG: DUF3822 family protein [Saprospiraceae bacterium]|nr:DUF3822 family protein [Saprospiraceae bacterium]
MVEAKNIHKDSLSILLRMDSFSFMTVDQEGNITRYQLQELSQRGSNKKHIDSGHLLGWIEDHHLQAESFSNIQINIDHGAFTLVPKQLFDADRWHTYLASSISKDNVAFTPVEQMQCVYSLPLELRQTLSVQFPSAIVRHLSESLYLYMNHDVSQEPTIYFVEKNGFAYLMAYKQQRMTILNRYAVGNWRDALYYMLLITKQLELQAEDVLYKLSANAILIKALHKQLTDRGMQCEVIDWKNGWRLPTEVVDSMQLFDLYCVHYADHFRTI